jgi:hypothetical protein
VVEFAEHCLSVADESSARWSALPVAENTMYAGRRLALEAVARSTTAAEQAEETMHLLQAELEFSTPDHPAELDGVLTTLGYLGAAHARLESATFRILVGFLIGANVVQFFADRSTVGQQTVAALTTACIDAMVAVACSCANLDVIGEAVSSLTTSAVLSRHSVDGSTRPSELARENMLVALGTYAPPLPGWWLKGRAGGREGGKGGCQGVAEALRSASLTWSRGCSMFSTAPRQAAPPTRSPNVAPTERGVRSIVSAFCASHRDGVFSPPHRIREERVCHPPASTHQEVVFSPTDASPMERAHHEWVCVRTLSERTMSGCACVR